MVCWGWDDYEQSSPPPGERFESVSVGAHHACGLRADGEAVCWGADESGQSTPPENERFVAISAGGYHTCGLRSDGVAVCWGDDESGQSSPPQGGEHGSVVNVQRDQVCRVTFDSETDEAICVVPNDGGQSSPPLESRDSWP